MHLINPAHNRWRPAWLRKRLGEPISRCIIWRPRRRGAMKRCWSRCVGMPFRRCRKRTPCKEEWLSIEWPVGATEPAKYWLSTLQADTTKRAARYAPKPPSTTPATSPSAGGFTICPRCGRSAFQPTAVFSKYQPSVTICLLAEEAFQKINRPIQVGQQRGGGLTLRRPSRASLVERLRFVSVLAGRVFQPRPPPALEPVVRVVDPAGFRRLHGL
jgi:hypothetical protein